MYQSTHVSIYTVLILFYTVQFLCFCTSLFRGYIPPFKPFLMNQRHIVRALNKGLQTSATIYAVAFAIHTTSIFSSHEITLLRSGHWISSFQTPFQTEACSTLHLLGFPTPSTPSSLLPSVRVNHTRPTSHKAAPRGHHEDKLNAERGGLNIIFSHSGFYREELVSIKTG